MRDTVAELEYFYVTVRHDDRPLVVRARDTLSREPHTAIVLGEAPDGQPLVLAVSRRASVYGAVLSALGFPEKIPERVETALDALEAEVLSAARTVGLEDVQGAAVYRTRRPVGELFGATMLARMLGSHSPLILDEDRYARSSQAEQVPATAAIALSPQPVTMMKSVRAHRYLAVPTRSGPVFLVETGPDEAHIDPDTLQPLRFEDLRHLPSAQFAWHDGGQVHLAPLADETAYRNAVRDANWVSWVASAHDVGTSLVELARTVQAFHDEGRVHGDLKPANAVITASGGVAIDPLGVAVGEVSPGVTPGWAAPEQILAQPVSPATDVYALGLMFARLLGAAIYGEERSFLIPIGGGERRRVRLLANPDVFIDPMGLPDSDAPPRPPRGWGHAGRRSQPALPRLDAGSVLSEDMQRYWGSLVRRAIAFDPGERPESAGVFADEAETLLAEEPLSRTISIRGGPGQLRRNVEVLGAFQPSWVIEDDW